MLITMKMLTNQYKISRQTVYNWISNGMPYKKQYIKGLKYRILFDTEVVDEWLEMARRKR